MPWLGQPSPYSDIGTASGGRPLTRLEARIIECHRLWQSSTTPDDCLARWAELQGLRVAAGQLQPHEFLEQEDVLLADAYRRGLADGEALNRLEDPK